MAESRYKVRGIALPFEAQYSSCSNIKPQKFDWIKILDGKGDYDIHVDNGLLVQPDHTILKEKRFGWVCESRNIVPNVYNFLIHSHKVLFENFYTAIYTCDQSLLDLDSHFKYCPNGSNYPWIRKAEWGIYEKTKICSMFASPKVFTEGHVYRHKVAKMAIDKGFDVFGGAHGTTRTVIDPMNPWNTKLEGIGYYMFSIIIENGNYDTYYTEKITDCFATGTIPIYWGTKNLPSQFDRDGIIWLEEGKENEILNSLNEDVYKQKLKAIKNNLIALSSLEIADDCLFGEITK
jgi:hypothetical protein